MIYARQPSDRVKRALDFIGDCAVKPGIIFRNRSRELVEKRWAVMVLLNEDGWSSSEIARYLGLNDHTTVLHGLRQAAHEFRVRDIVAQAKQRAQPHRDSIFMDWMRRYASACQAKGEAIFNGESTLAAELIGLMQ